MSPLLDYITSVATGSASLVLLVDYVRLRVQAHREAKAAVVAAALGSHDPTAKCTGSASSASCSSLRSKNCSDGRCRYHCRTYCRCKGNG